MHHQIRACHPSGDDDRTSQQASPALFLLGGVPRRTRISLHVHGASMTLPSQQPNDMLPPPSHPSPTRDHNVAPYVRGEYDHLLVIYQNVDALTRDVIVADFWERWRARVEVRIAFFAVSFHTARPCQSSVKSWRAFMIEHLAFVIRNLAKVHEA
jgi:hypothetical protein